MKHVVNLAIAFILLVSQPAIASVSQPGDDVAEDSIRIVESIQQLLRQKEQSLLANQQVLQQNRALLQQNLAALHQIRKHKDKTTVEWADLTAAIEKNLEVQEENQRALIDLAEAITVQRNSYARNQQLLHDLEKGYSVDFENRDSSAGILSQLHQGIRESQMVLAKNRDQLHENQAALSGNLQILTALSSSRR